MAKAKQQTNEAEELETALGLSCKRVTVGSELVTVSKFKFKDISRVLASVREMEKRLRGSVTADSAGDLITMFPDLGAQWIEYATGKSAEWVGEQDHEEACMLMAAVVEVNSRFFTGETMAPMYKVMSRALGVSDETAAETTTSD